MRHGKKFNHLGRQKGHRKALLTNMAVSLIQHKRINTTLAKAKALRLFVEPLITKAKTDSSHSRRVVFSYLQKKDAVQELFGDIATKVADRPGGYTRILKTGTRLGDNADMCLIELVDYNENLLTTEAPKKKSRRRSTKKAVSADKVAEETVVEDADVVEDVKAEAPKKVAKAKAPKKDSEKDEGKAE
jgi:large subunit ribosomal protein L17